MSFGRRHLCFFVVLLIGAACNSSGGLASVECRLTKDGQPLSRAELRFNSLGTDSTSVGAVSLDDGSCYVDLGERAGLPAGDYSITVTFHETADGAPLPAGEEGQALKLDGKSVRKQFLFRRTLIVGTNALELKIEDGEEIIVPDEEDPALDAAIDPTVELVE